MGPLIHSLERTLAIQASPETVFRFFTDSVRWAGWWGAGSTIDARPGGRVLIRHPNGVENLGEVVEVNPPQSIVFTYGYVSGNPFPPGESRVTIRLEPEASGTRLRLMHEFDSAPTRDHHIQGWRFQLSLFANLVADEVFATAKDCVDDWFEGWAVPGDAERTALFARIADPAVTFRDRYSMLDGLTDLIAHTGAAQKFMPGVKMHRKGEPRHCQGTVLADWAAEGPNGAEIMSGTNVFVLGADGRIASVTGIANK